MAEFRLERGMPDGARLRVAQGEIGALELADETARIFPREALKRYR